MNDRRASVVVCDDIRVEVNGKLVLIGLYTSDIVIPTDIFTAFQMHFLFMAECVRSDPFKSLRFEVMLPGNDPVSVTASVPPALDEKLLPERERMYVRQDVYISPANLRPGRIMAKVIHERGEIDAHAGWIVTAGLAAAVVAPPNL